MPAARLICPMVPGAQPTVAARLRSDIIVKDGEGRCVCITSELPHRPLALPGSHAYWSYGEPGCSAGRNCSPAPDVPPFVRGTCLVFLRSALAQSSISEGREGASSAVPELTTLT